MAKMMKLHKIIFLRQMNCGDAAFKPFLCLLLFQGSTWWRVIPTRRCRGIMTTSAWPRLQPASPLTFINLIISLRPLMIREACPGQRELHYILKTQLHLILSFS